VFSIRALVGFSFNGGTFTTYIGELKRTGWLIQDGALMSITLEE
jgi:hypothetical protein